MTNGVLSFICEKTYHIPLLIAIEHFIIYES